MQENGTIRMERVNQFIELVHQYVLREKLEDKTVDLKRVYVDCDAEINANVNEDICQAADDIRSCILKKKEEYGVKSLGESIWL